MKLKISVIIPAWNREKMILGAIESVLCQSVLPFELIVVDDGSTDQTEEVVRTYAKRLNGSPVPFCYIRQENAGPAATRNTGIRIATGDYVAFLDSDDTWTKDAVKGMGEAVEQYPELDVVFGRAENVAVEGRSDFIHNKKLVAKLDQTANGPFSATSLLLQSNFIAVGAVMVRRNAALSVGLFDASLRLSEDYDFWLRLALAGFNFGYVNQVLLNRNLHGGNLVNEKLALKEASCRVLMKRLGQVPVELRNVALKRLNELHYDLGSAFLRHKEYIKASSHLHSAKVVGWKKFVLWAKCALCELKT